MIRTQFVVPALALLVCAAAVMAQDPAGPAVGPRPGAGRVAGTRPAFSVVSPTTATFTMIAEFDLTEEQRTKLTPILGKGIDALSPLRDTAAKACLELRKGVATADIDAQKLAQLVADAQKAEAAIVTAELDIWAQVRGVLTADQLTKLLQFISMRSTGGIRQRPAPGTAPPTTVPTPPEN